MKIASNCMGKRVAEAHSHSDSPSPAEDRKKALPDRCTPAWLSHHQKGVDRPSKSTRPGLGPGSGLQQGRFSFEETLAPASCPKSDSEPI